MKQIFPDTSFQWEPVKRKSLFVLLLAVLSAGCGRSDLPNLGLVSGVVTVDGRPPGNAIVNFSPLQPGRPSTAETDAEGNYELLYLSDVYGAIAGDHAATVEKIVTGDLDDLPDNPGEMTPEQRALMQQNQPLPPKASDGTLKLTVQEGDNTLNIEL